MAKTSATPSAGGSPSVSPLYVWAAVALLLTLVIAGVHWFGQEKPVTPKNSEVKYVAYKDPKLNPADFGPSGSGSASSSTKQQMAEAEGKKIAAQLNDPVQLTGTITDADTGKPVSDATIFLKRTPAKEELLALYAFQDQSQKTPEPQSDPDAPVNDNTGRAASEERPLKPGSASDEKWEDMDDQVNTHRRADTNSEGNYRIGLRTGGSYQVYVFHDEFITYNEEAFAVPEGETRPRLDIKLKRGATVSGRITERGTGKGAVGVRVCVYLQPALSDITYARPDIAQLVMMSSHRDPGRFGNSNLTDDKGNYKITGLERGEGTVFLSIGDAPYRFSGLPPMRSVTVAQEGQDIRNVNFVLDVAGVVWGYVFDETGKPIKGAEVVQCFSDSVVAQVAEAATNLRPPIHDSTDGDGLYRLFGPPLNRECRVFVGDDDYCPQISDPFVLTPTNREVRVDVYLRAGTTVHGRVLNRMDGSPIGRAQINCLPAVARLLSPFDAALGFNEVKSKEDGSFVVPHLPVGEHKLYAMADGFKLSLQGEPIFSDGIADMELVLYLDPVDAGEHIVYGTVTDSSGRRIPGAHVGLANLGLEGLAGAVGGRDTKTDAKGMYVFERVEEGTLILMADADGYTSTRVDDVKLDEPTDIELETAGRVSGRVVVRDTGLPPAACSVRAHPESTPEGDLLSSLQALGGFSDQCENGEFSLELPEGEYLLVANPQGASPGRLQVSVGPGERVDGVVIEVTLEGGRIAGRVVMRNGQSPAGATVKLGREGASYAPILPMMEDLQFRAVQVNEDGSFEFDHLAGGTYRLTAQLEGYADGQSKPVTLGDGQSVGGVEIVLGSGGGLQGNVVIGGEVAPGAIVTIAGTGFNQVTRADRNGQYVFQNLPPGEYLVAAISPDQATAGRFMPTHGRVVIQEGRVTHYNFGDPQGATVEGLCTPPPPLGHMGFAILRIAGTGEEISHLDFRSLTSMFTGDMSAVPSIVGLAQIDHDGWFQIENAPEGSYSLDVYYLTLGSFVNSSAQRVYSTMVDIIGRDTVSLQIAVAQ